VRGGLAKAKARALVAWLMAWPMQCGAAELIATVQGGDIGVEIRGLELPETLRTELASGLTNRIVVRLALIADAQTVTLNVVVIAVKYDLWEESFDVTMLIDDRPAAARSFSRVEEVLASLSHLSVDAVLQSPPLERGRAYTLQADVLLDPIDQERMEKIRHWVAQNSTLPARGAPVGGGGASQSAELFNRIFQQYASGADVASAWRELVVSQPFRVEDLPTRPPTQ
jgi:hypothetical protein